jgi:hypothetical protein
MLSEIFRKISALPMLILNTLHVEIFSNEGTCVEKGKHAADTDLRVISVKINLKSIVNVP